MKKHIRVYYEAFDGMIFDDKDDCLNHEFMLLYDKAGIKFMHMLGGPVHFLEEDPDFIYNAADYIIIDRTKKEENDRFIDWVHKNFGWILLDTVKNRFETKYRLTMNAAIPVDDHEP